MSHQVQLQILRLKGWSDERLSAEIGKLRVGEGPSAQSIYRWRTGKTNPTRAYRGVLERLFEENITEGESENEQD